MDTTAPTPQVLVIGLDLFEQVLNLVRRYAPDAAIAFNSTPADTFDAAARWVDNPGPASAR